MALTTSSVKWGNRPYELKEGVRRWNGRLTDCPVCWIVRGLKVRVTLKGKRYPREDRPVECPVCHRTWESLRWFLNGWCQYWIPRIEADMRALGDSRERNEAWQAEQEEFLWRRQNEVAEAVENGWWNPKIRDDLQLPTARDMEHFQPNLHVPLRARKPPAWLSD